MTYSNPPTPADLDPLVSTSPIWTEWRARVPAERAAALSPSLAALGLDASNHLAALARAAEAQPPRHEPWDAWGRRVDRLILSAAWQALERDAVERGLVAMGRRDGRVVQAAHLVAWSAVSATASCPLAMTDAAVTVLSTSARPDLAHRWVPRLVSTDPALAARAGQWMTERTGGSDVSGTATVARPIDEHRATLHGRKWFSSATSADVALAVAKEPDGRLSLFAVPVERDSHGALVGLSIDRLKDKLGTRAMPTAELTLDGVVAERVGLPGRGVATIAPMLTVTRWHNAVASASGMWRAAQLAADWATRRFSFGRPIAEHPLHRETLLDLDAEAAGAIATAFAVASLMDADDPFLAKVLRAAVPMAKATLGKAAVRVASEALECFGGMGAIESTDLPRLLRDAQVLPIWEGTTNVLSLDLDRAERKIGATTALLTWLSDGLPKHLIPLRDEIHRWPVEEATARRRTLALGRLFTARALYDRANDGDHAAQRAERFARLA